MGALMSSLETMQGLICKKALRLEHFLRILFKSDYDGFLLIIQMKLSGLLLLIWLET